jgi:hypothetical protein
VVGPIRCYGTLYHDSDDPLETGARVHAIERPPRKALNGSTHSILPVVALDYGRMVLQARQSRWMDVLEGGSSNDTCAVYESRVCSTRQCIHGAPVRVADTIIGLKPEWKRELPEEWHNPPFDLFSQTIPSIQT